MSMKENIAAASAVLALGVFLTACDNTIRGIGQDTKETVSAVKDSVEGKPKENAE